MVTVLTGENTFAVQRALREIEDAFIELHGDMAVEHLDGNEIDVERLRASLQSAPFLAPRKLVIIRSPSSNKRISEQIELLVQSLSDTNDLLIIEQKIDKRSSYYKFLKHTAVYQEFAELDESAMVRWLVDAAKRDNSILTVTDARFLIACVGLDQQLLAGELQKLVTYNRNVTRTSIELLVDVTPQAKIFDLLEAAFSGRLAKTLQLYTELREQRVDVSQIIALLAWQLRVLALLITAGSRSPHEVVHVTKLSPYTVQKSQAIAARLTLPRLKKLIQMLLAIDARSKRQVIDMDEALKNYLLYVAD